MANMCLNVVEFQNITTEQARVKTVEMIEYLGRNGYYAEQLAGLDSLMFESKWSCPTPDLTIGAEELGVDIAVTVSEWSSSIYGREYIDKIGNVVSQIYLENEEFDLVEEDEESGNYLFEGEQWECKDDALDVLLKRKEGLTNL